MTPALAISSCELSLEHRSICKPKPGCIESNSQSYLICAVLVVGFIAVAKHSGSTWLTSLGYARHVKRYPSTRISRSNPRLNTKAPRDGILENLVMFDVEIVISANSRPRSARNTPHPGFFPRPQMMTKSSWFILRGHDSKLIVQG